MIDINCKYEIGDGKKVRFWIDKWCGDQPLSIAFYDLFKICTQPQILVADVLVNNELHISFKRQLTARQWNDFWLLQKIVHDHLPLFDVQDRIRWLRNKDGIYTTSSMYDWLDDRGINNSFYTTIWNLRIPLKIKMFLWIVSKRKLLTKDNLLARGWTGDFHCCFCNKLETVDHLLLQCGSSSKIWSWFLIQFGVRLPNSLEDLRDIETQLPNNHRLAYRLWCSAILWILWKNRNDCCFNSIHLPTFRTVCFKIHNILRYWSGLWSKKLKMAVATISPMLEGLPFQLPAHEEEDVLSPAGALAWSEVEMEVGCQLMVYE